MVGDIYNHPIGSIYHLYIASNLQFGTSPAIVSMAGWQRLSRLLLEQHHGPGRQQAVSPKVGPTKRMTRREHINMATIWICFSNVIMVLIVL